MAITVDHRRRGRELVVGHPERIAAERASEALKMVWGQVWAFILVIAAVLPADTGFITSTGFVRVCV